MLRQDLSSHFCCFRGRRRHTGAICAHYFPAEWFLLIGHFYHKDFAVQSQICACHRQSRSPLSCSCFRSNSFQTLFLCVVCLCDSGIQFMAPACIISLKFIINLCRRLEFFFQAVCPYQRRRPVHSVKFLNFIRDIDIWRSIIQFLFCQLPAEYLRKLIQRHRLQRSRI